MKKVMLMLVVTIGMLFNVQANAAPELHTHTAPLFIKMLPTVVAGGLIYYAAKNSEVKNACYNESSRNVAWKNNPNGYSFSVAGCDYQANKASYVLK